MVNQLVKTQDGRTQDVPVLQADDLSKYTVKIDKVDSSTAYYGFAVPGTLTSQAKWRIQKKSTSGNVTTYSWADSDTKFDNVWDDRASFTYG